MTALDDRLRALGDALDLDEPGLTDGVLARLDAPISPAGAEERAGVTRRALRVAAMLVLGLAVSVALVPSSRSAVADWFGFDGADVERRPDLVVPTRPDPVDRSGMGTVVVVDGDEILLTEFVGVLEGAATAKSVGEGSTVLEVSVDGAPGLWIDGDPHEVVFTDADGTLVFEGFAGNTLLWQDGDVVRRLEGFDDLESAIDFASSITD